MQNSVSKITKEDRCTGCSACYNVCSQEAIEMQLSMFGFYLPKIDSNKCISCGKCLQYCPMNFEKQNKYGETSNYNITAYGAWSKNDSIRLSSSSGGIFTELAISILHEDGVVFGAGWNNQILQHMTAAHIEDLVNLQGSKYIPSYIGKSYIKVCKYLELGKKVLFVGTPCQIAALKGVVKHENLVTVDLICLGVPSLVAFKKYIISKIGNKEIKTIMFRDKKYGWENYSIKITTMDNYVYESASKYDPFMVGFLKTLYLNKVCYSCPFAKLPRMGELTLGDYWGVDEKIRNQKGISVVLVNNRKGEILLDKLIFQKRIILFNTEIKAISEKNKRLIEGQYNIPAIREELLQELIKNDFKLIEQKFIKPPDRFLLEKIKPRLMKEQLIIFGTGSASQRIFHFFNEKSIKFNIKYFVDNNQSKWEQYFFSKKICEPKKLLQERKESIFVIVASSYYTEIKAQLERMGFLENVHFINGMHLLI